MSLMRVRRAAQLTLPGDVRRALNVKEGDYLEAHVRKDGVLLTPVALVGRAQALSAIRKAAAQVRKARAQKPMSESAIAGEVKKLRRTHA